MAVHTRPSAPAQALADSELNVEQWDALEGRRTTARGDEEGTCRGPRPSVGPALCSSLGKGDTGRWGDEERALVATKEMALALGMCLLKPWSPTLWGCMGFPRHVG